VSQDIKVEYLDEQPEQHQHACIMEAQLDVMAYNEQYMYRCRCHEGSFHIWQPGDALDKCPGGTPYPDPRTLILDCE
jgi:hypothetical protein